jgi:hypothetical protein
MQINKKQMLVENKEKKLEICILKIFHFPGNYGEKVKKKKADFQKHIHYKVKL